MRPLICLYDNLRKSRVFLNDCWLTHVHQAQVNAGAGIGRPAHWPFGNRPTALSTSHATALAQSAVLI